jgi:2-polyprenyl-3-methyl-5-hydroxy-6-metoxy-1,4-benzoquinol methylase
VREWLAAQAAGGYVEHDPETGTYVLPVEHAAVLADGTSPVFQGALDGVEAKLRRGARVADVGAGLGIATILLAQAYPESTFVGFDSHLESIQAARANAAEAGVEDRVRFELASATGFPGDGYDLIACFDALHTWATPRPPRATSARRSLPRGRDRAQPRAGSHELSGSRR